MKRAAIYTRLSHDPDGSSTATARQEADCRALAEGKGWLVTTVYQDNDTSAYQRRVKRPEFERMVADLQAGELDYVIAWRSDRLVRQPRDLERFLDACQVGRAAFVSCTEPEFDGASGLLILRMLVAFANHESGVKAERVARKRQEKAELGHPPAGGVRMFGYDRTGWQVVEEEAALIRDAAERIVAGESVTSICDEWNGAGVALPRGGQRWSPGNLRRTLTSPRLAALRVYKGRVLGPGGGQWPPILSETVWRRLQAAIERPTPAGPRRYLLSGMLRCGKCGAVLYGQPKGRPQAPYYNCPPPRWGGCNGIGVKAELVEAEVVERALYRLGGADLDALLAGQSDDGDELLATLRDDEAALEQLAKDHYVEKMLSRPEYLAARAGLEERVQATRRRLARSEASVLSRLPRGEDELRRLWTKRTVDWRRAVLKAVIERIDVRPANRNPHFNPERIKVTWRA